MEVSKFELSSEDHFELLEILERYVRHETSAVKVVLLVCLSSKSPNPLNLFIKGESSTGKTWIPTNIVKLFPPQNVWLLGGLSPKALIHQKGVLVDENLQPIEKPKRPDPKLLKENPTVVEEYKKAIEEYQRKLENPHILIDMSGKILLFLEPPDRETFNVLRPILSHDAWEIKFPFVDKVDGRLLTVTVVIRGWPATIFCGSDVQWMEDMITRSLTISPKVSEEKFRAAHKVTALRFMNPMEIKIREKEVERGKSIINKVFDSFQALIPYADVLAEIYPSNLPRTMRDFRYFLSLIETHTVLSWHPLLYSPAFADSKINKIGSMRIATLEDLREVEKIWSEIYIQTVSGLPETAIKLYDIIVELDKSGIEPTVRVISKKFLEKYGRSLAGSTIRSSVKNLEDYGLVEVQKQQNVNIYFPLENKPANPTFQFSATVSKRFSRKELEKCLDETVAKIKTYYNTSEEPFLTLKPSIDSESYRYPFPDEALDTLYRVLTSATVQSERKSSSNSEKELKNPALDKNVKPF